MVWDIGPTLMEQLMLAGPSSDEVKCEVSTNRACFFFCLPFFTRGFWNSNLEQKEVPSLNPRKGLKESEMEWPGLVLIQQVKKCPSLHHIKNNSSQKSAKGKVEKMNRIELKLWKVMEKDEEWKWAERGMTQGFRDGWRGVACWLIVQTVGHLGKETQRVAEREKKTGEKNPSLC